MYKKGQLATMDLIGSVVIFALLIIGIISFWNIYTTRFNANVDREEIMFSLVGITDLLVENQGVPTNWSNTNVQVVGLVSTDRRLDPDKLNALININYDTLKSLFNVERYDFKIRVVDLNGALIEVNEQFMEIGNSPDASEDSVIKMRRFALYGSQKVVVEMSMWE